MRRLLALVLTAVLLAGSAGAAWSDAGGHWAGEALERAGSRGWLSGYEDGTVRPDDALTWGHYLTMLGRAFWPDALAQTPPEAEGGHWASGARAAAESAGVLGGLDAGDLDAPLTRQEAAVLLYAALSGVGGVSDLEGAQPAFTDWDSVPEPCRAAVAQMAGRGLLGGYEDGSFRGENPLTRAEGTVLLDRLAQFLDAWAEEHAGTLEEPEEPIPAEGETPAAPSGDPALRALGENDAKLVRLYGTAERRRYDNEEEAAGHMAQVTVPVWKLDKATGIKTTGHLTFTVHEAIVDDMTAIFTEIYMDPEQFPIYEIGGYDWRGDSAKGEHNCGTAVDINAGENYQVYASGAVGAGKYWKPGEDPWSIPENGSVVRIFNAYGYSWGGNAWPTNKDYMHFSYLGV